MSRIIYYNEGKFLDTMIGIFLFYMKEKMRNRVRKVPLQNAAHARGREILMTMELLEKISRLSTHDNCKMLFS